MMWELFLITMVLLFVRGHHCAMPIMDYYQVPAMCRASLGLYNNKADIDALVNALLRIENY